MESQRIGTETVSEFEPNDWTRRSNTNVSQRSLIGLFGQENQETTGENSATKNEFELINIFQG